MRVVPLTLAQANELVASWHRHHKPVRGHRFSIGCEHEGVLVGAAIVGRPVARELPPYAWAEVTRLVTDGTTNACSFLYGACARIARAMGFERLQTAILVDEPGTTLKAAGWRFDHLIKGRDWNTAARGGRRTDQPMDDKLLWVAW